MNPTAYPQDSSFDVRRPGNHMIYGSGKIYTHSTGLSVAFRQFKATSHCRFIHGYAIKVSFEFSLLEGATLDERNWVVDFGSLKSLKGWLELMFDHTLLVAKDDPELEVFKMLHERGIAHIRVVEATGCEAMARMIWEYTDQWLKDYGYKNVNLDRCTVWEHDANYAFYGRAKNV